MYTLGTCTCCTLLSILLLLQLAAALTKEESLIPLLIPAAAAHFGPRGPHAPAADLRQAVQQARLEVQDSWRNRRSIVLAVMSGDASFKDVTLVFLKTLKANTFVMPDKQTRSDLARHTVVLGTTASATATCKALQPDYGHHCVSPLATAASLGNASEHASFESVSGASR
jgi:hypothetical protein